MVVAPILLTLLLSGPLLAEDPAPASPAAQARAAYDQFRNSGQGDAARAELRARLATLDEQHPEDWDYVLAKSLVLSWIDDDEASQAAFERVPDAALVERWHISNRLKLRLAGDLDAAVPLVDRLAELSATSLAALIHDDYAQRFAPTRRSGTDPARAHAFLQRFAGAEHAAAWRVLAPLAAWTDALAHPADAAHWRRTADTLLALDTPVADRYLLLTALHLADDPARRDGALALLAQTAARAERRVVNAQAEPGRVDDATRAGLRYRVAFAHAALARLGDAPAASWEAAARWSPDARDMAQSHGFFYERATLGGLPEYHSRYAEFLERAERSDDALAAWTRLALSDPERLPELASAFERLRPGAEFGPYWTAQLVAQLPLIEDFELLTPAGERVHSSDFRGRWLLLDFWGTWCLPCQEELPALQAFADELRAASSTQVAVLGIACRDTPDTVSRFMQTHEYDFPTALGTETLVERFAVHGFPTKILVTPEGRWFEIRYGTHDWRAVVDRFVPKSH